MQMLFNSAAWPAKFQPGNGELRAAALGLAVKTVVSLVMLVFFYQFPVDVHWHHLDVHWYTGADDAAAWYVPFANWDGQHYLRLAEGGYNQVYDKSGGRQFYPLYPMLIRLLSTIFSPWVAGLLITYICTAGMCVFLYRTAEHFGARRGYSAVLLVMAFPTAFFTSAIYPEALFLFLMTGFIWHLLVTRSRAGLVYFALLPLTRGNAAFVFAGFILFTALQYAQYWHAAAGERKRQSRIAAKAKNKNRMRHKYRKPAPEIAPFEWRYYLLCCVAFAVGIAGYFLFYSFATGDPLAGIKAQKILGHGNSIANLFDPAHFFANNVFARIADWFHVPSALDRIVFVLLVAALPLFAARKYWRLLCFYIPLIYGPASVGFGMQSFSRYALVAAPFLALALAGRHKRALYALCVIAFASQLGLAWRFSVGLWVG